MHLFKFLLSCLLLYTVLTAGGQESGIYHQPPDSLISSREADLEFIVIANYTDVRFVRGFFRSDTTQTYIERPLIQDSQGIYHLTIAPSEFQGDTLYYFLFAQLSAGGWLSAPGQQPKRHPWKIPLVYP